MNTSGEDKACKARVIEKCWGYLNENFHKFTEHNKIKVALALCTKDIPQEIKGDGFGTNIKLFQQFGESELRGVVSLLRERVSAEKPTVVG